MFSVGENEIANVQNILDQTARDILVFMGENPRLSHQSRYRLEKFMFGLMNQKLGIVERVKKSGTPEFRKVLQFVGNANEALRKADAELGL